MEELFDMLLPICLECGVNIFDFWELTYGEIILVVNNYKQKEKARIQETAYFNYALANLIGISVARLIDKNAVYPSIHEVFPNIFVDAAVKPQQQDWRIAKDRMMKFTTAHNKKRGEEEP